jgi:hypothetical protein
MARQRSNAKLTKSRFKKIATTHKRPTSITARMVADEKRYRKSGRRASATAAGFAAGAVGAWESLVKPTGISPSKQSRAYKAGFVASLAAPAGAGIAVTKGARAIQKARKTEILKKKWARQAKREEKLVKADMVQDKKHIARLEKAHDALRGRIIKGGKISKMDKILAFETKAVSRKMHVIGDKAKYPKGSKAYQDSYRTLGIKEKYYYSMFPAGGARVLRGGVKRTKYYKGPGKRSKFERRNK